MRSKRLSILIVVSLLALLLASCSAAAPEEEPQFVAAEATMAPAAALPEEEAAPAPTPPPGVAALPGDAGSGLMQSSARAERMVIKDAEMDLLVADTDVALDGVTLIAKEYGGYIVASHTWSEDEFKYASVRLGVPSQEFENVLRRLRGLAILVNSEIASGEDVTDQYVDLQSRVKNLEATRDRIREFLNEAKTVEEALKVNEQLSEIEGQIEEAQGRLNYFKDRAAYSTIDITLNPQVPTPTITQTPTTTQTPTPVPWLPGETVEGAADLMGGIARGLVTALIWIVVGFGPFLLIAGLLLWLALRWRRSRRKPKDETKAPDAGAVPG